MPYTMSEAEGFLCEGIRHISRIDSAEIAAKYKTIGDDTIFQSATTNGVASNIAHMLGETLYQHTQLPAHWLDAFEKTRARIQAYMDELDIVAKALAEAGIALVALKNSGITRAIYPHPGASPMGDVDVLVRPSDFLSAHAIISNLGYKLKFRNEFEEDDINEAFASGGAEYSKNLDCGEHLWFELQWRPIAGRWIQPDQEPRADDLIERAIPVSGSRALILSPEDNLLQVCVHTAKHTFVRAPGFRLHTDVDRIVTGQTINWELFTSRVKQLHIKTAVYLSLDMARELLGTPIPTAVLTEISPSQWKIRLMKSWLDKVGIFNPDGNKWSNLGYIVFVSLLYDDVSDMLKGIFPSPTEIKNRHEEVNSYNLPAYYVKRFLKLVFRRTGI